MTCRCVSCGRDGASIYELSLVRLDPRENIPDTIQSARMVELCPACRDRLAARVAALVPVWDGDGVRESIGAEVRP